MNNLNNIPIPDGFDLYWEPWTDAYNNETTDSVKQEIAEAFEEEGIDQQEEGIQFYSEPVKSIMTPFGILPLTEHTLASTQFKFWTGHTNFNLLKSHCLLIENILGVETLDILTPLRFRIAVGRLFKDREIMNKVRNVLLEKVNYDNEEQG